MSDRRAILLLLVLLTGLLALIFGDVFLHPNRYLFGTMGDSIKSLFTFAWYVKFDSGLHFSGMNYPWGEHIIFTDNQPLFSIPLRYINRYLFPLENHLAGIINGLVFFSMLASAVVLFFILRKCLLPAWYAILGAILIVLLSPQHYIISHQYALTNTLVLPAIWLTIIRLFENPGKVSRYVWVLLVLLAAGFVHVYFLPMGVLLLAGHLLWFAVQQWRKKSFHWKQIAALLLAATLPLLIFKAFLFFTDTITDRPETPGNFIEGKANIAGLFYPVKSLAAEVLKTVSPAPVPAEQNFGYVGLATILCLLLAALKAFGYLRKGNFKQLVNPVLPKLLQMGLWAGILILIFAAAIPFRFGLMHLLDYLPPLKQFRVLHRFVWLYYYVFTVFGIFTIYQIFRFLKLRKKRLLANGWLTFMLLLWLADALVLLKVEADIVNMNKLANAFYGKEAYHLSDLLKQANRQASDFQMIIPIPYFSDGSEKIGYHNWGGTMYQSMKGAYQSGIPLSTASLARTSLNQVLLRTQLLSSDSIQKELLPQLPNQKPILITVTDSAEKDYEKRLVQKAAFLTRYKNITLYELPLATLKTVYREPEKPAKDALQLLPANVVYETFSNRNSAKWLYRKGALTAETGPAVLFNNILPNASDSLTYEFSVWVNATAAIGIPTIKLEEINARHEVVNQQSVNLRGATEIYKDWLKTTIPFRLKNTQNRIKITAEGKNIVADELIIRPVKQPFYFYAEDQKQLIRNNYPVYQP
ncbi:hypothetical protein I5M27_14540 [Adhaeribacter sp. BT258]|uniref:DUF6311 domain-containing protein n=1 Tax=Adhaeribacter terrigena TaxID=2793070 RepID=A0ABS1C4U6_9BACT|nr:hypothetical protein [Adhaeribacter terrigena]MBK0404211.1 hypothetical protein [Adhaeribacter terrigena]